MSIETLFELHLSRQLKKPVFLAAEYSTPETWKRGAGGRHQASYSVRGEHQNKSIIFRYEGKDPYPVKEISYLLDGNPRVTMSNERTTVDIWRGMARGVIDWTFFEDVQNPTQQEYEAFCFCFPDIIKIINASRLIVMNIESAVSTGVNYNKRPLCFDLRKTHRR